MDPCLVNNGGCSENTDCIKTGPNTVNSITNHHHYYDIDR